MFTSFLIVFLCVGYQVSYSLKPDYYWREYTGEIPEDAIVAGKDTNGGNIYIGQAYIKNWGLIVTQITPGRKEVRVPMKGIKIVDKFVKILCGPQEKVYWMSADSKSLHLSLIDKHAVIGGHEDGGGYIGIGRISHGGEVKVGKVNTFSSESAYFYFDDNGLERLVTSYQILMYDDNLIDLRIKSF